MEFLKKLGEALGLDPELLKDEGTAEALILQQIQTLIGKPAPTEEPVDDAGATDEEELSQGGGAPAAAPAAGGGGGKVVKESTTREYAASSPSPVMVTMLSENRGMKIDRLVEAGKMTPAQADKLRSQYASKDACTLALSSNSDGKEFDAMLEAFEMGTPSVATGEKTGGQTVALSDGRKGKLDENPLVKAAKARAEKAKK